jgi:hypothetical protein
MVINVFITVGKEFKNTNHLVTHFKVSSKAKLNSRGEFDNVHKPTHNRKEGIVYKSP